MLDLDGVIRDLMRRRTEQIDAQLAALNPGETLCIHDDRDSAFAVDRDVSTFTIREKTHVLAAGVTCDESGRREQYGPAPADWREDVGRMQQ